MVNIDELIESDGLYHTRFSEAYAFDWRLLTLKEYKVFRSLRDNGILPAFSVYQKVFERCYVRKLQFFNQRIPAGMLITVGELIMWLSGDCELTTLKDDIYIAREVYPSDSVTERMKQVIFTAFPSYRIEEVEAWTRSRLIHNFVVSEHVLMQRGFQYEPLDIDEIKHPDEVDTPDAIPDKYVHNINFEREAAAQKRELGAWATEDANERAYQESQQITTKQAQQLDKLRAARGN